MIAASRATGALEAFEAPEAGVLPLIMLGKIAVVAVFNPNKLGKAADDIERGRITAINHDQSFAREPVTLGPRRRSQDALNGRLTKSSFVVQVNYCRDYRHLYILSVRLRAEPLLVGDREQTRHRADKPIHGMALFNPES